MTKNRSLVVLLVVVALTVVLTGGLMASNMGFKLNRVLVSGSEETSNSGQQFVALPYNRQVGIDTAKELFIDIELVGTVQNIQKYLTLTDTFQTYGKGDTNYDINPGEAYFVKMNQTKLYTPSHY